MNIKLVYCYEMNKKIYEKLVDNDNKILGFVIYELNEQEVFIVNISMYNKRKGFGSFVVKTIHERFPDKNITGEALTEAIGFWSKMGAVFDKKYIKIKEGLLEVKIERTPFCIKY